MKFRILSVLMIVLGLSVATSGEAQTLLSEDFTDITSSVAKDGNGNVLGGNWLFFNGACLTAGTSPVTTTISIPGCVIDGVNDVLGTYYKKASDGDQYLSGGSSGYLGSTAGAEWQRAPEPRPGQGRCPSFSPTASPTGITRTAQSYPDMHIRPTRVSR